MFLIRAGDGLINVPTFLQLMHKMFCTSLSMCRYAVWKSVMAMWCVGVLHYHLPLAHIVPFHFPRLFLDQVRVQAPRNWKEIVPCAHENRTIHTIFIEWDFIYHLPHLLERCLNLIHVAGTYCERSNYCYALLFQHNSPRKKGGNQIPSCLLESPTWLGQYIAQNCWTMVYPIQVFWG